MVKLSIITPSYNQGRFIVRTIESVLSQSVAELEYWVVDGGSTDDTRQILLRYGDRLKWLSEKDAGQADAVNKGMGLSSGDIIGWLNSDDVYYPGVLPEVMNYFEEHPEVQILYGDADHIDEQDNVLEPYPTEDWNYERLLETCYICQPAVFFRRSLMEKVGALNTKLQYCMDYEYWLRVGKVAEMVRFPDKLAGSRFYPETKTLGCREKVHAEIMEMISDITGKFSLYWAANLGKIVAEERGLCRGSLWQNVRFAYVVGTTLLHESRRHGYTMSMADWLMCLGRGRRTVTAVLRGRGA